MITLASFNKVIRIVLLIIVVAAAYIVLIPPIPSEANSQQKLGFLNLSTLISLVLFYFAVVLSKGIQRLSKLRCLWPKAFLLFYSVCLVLHLLIRSLLWQFGHLSEYGYPLYNIIVTSLIYSLLMSVVLIPVQYFQGKIKEEQ